MSDDVIVVDAPVTPAEPVTPADAKVETPPATGAESQPGSGKPDNTPPEIKLEIKLERDRRREAVAQLAESDRRLAQALDVVAKLSAPAAPEEEPEPKPDQFETDAAYYRALGGWEAKRQVKAEFAAERKKDAEAKVAQERATVQKGFNERVEAARGKYDDFNDVVLDDNVHISKAMGEAIVTSPHGGELVYWLGKNRAEAARIAQLPEHAAAREIGRIEASLATPATAVTKPAISTAPAPVKPVGASNAVAKPPEQMNADEYYAYLGQQERRRR